MSSLTQIKKNNLQELTIIFKEKILLNPYRLENLKKYAIKGELDKNLLRPIAWKLFLEVFPNSSSIIEWVEIISNQREEYKKKIRKFCKIEKFKGGDPLCDISKKKKKNNMQSEDNVLKNTINKDLDRTHQNKDLFLQNKVKNILANVLYIWSKENKDISYRQGMNELLAIIFLSIYPYYFVSISKPKSTKNDILNYLKDIDLNKDEIYIFFHDEEEIQSDLFYLFEALMKKGMKNLFDPLILTKDNPQYKLYEIFPEKWKNNDSDFDKPTYVYRRCDLLIKEKLKSLDKDLYSHFKKINIDCCAFLQKWFRCIFCREFEIEKVFKIWDIVLENEYENSNIEKYSFFFMESICIAMIFLVRDSVKVASEDECFVIFFNYPKINEIMDLIKLALKVDQAIKERLKGKNSNVYDILGIMKPIESQPTQIFSPHMYNQIKKNNENKNLNNFSLENNKNDKKNINDNIVPDSDDKHINIDENTGEENVNFNEETNLNNNEEHFFNNTNNNLENDEQVNNKSQNEDKNGLNKQESFTEKNKENQLNPNEDDDNNIIKNTYVNNNNFSGININDEIDIYNNQNTNLENNNQNEETTNINNQQRKFSTDSGIDVEYNKQDIIDIVNKLKEINEKYNMYFSDQDKNDFKIIINYLKGKI